MRVIYSGFDNEYVRIIEHLNKKYGWSPSFIFSSQHMESWARITFPGAGFYGWMRLREGDIDYTNIGPAAPLDIRIIDALAPHQAFCMELMEDATGWNFSFQERRRYYYDVLRFWNSVLKNFKPELFVSASIPHVVTDYMLYQLCRYYGIKTMFINAVPTFNWNKTRYHHINVSLENQSKIFESKYLSKTQHDLSAHLKNYFSSVRSSEGLTPPYVAHFWAHHGKKWNPSFWNGLLPDIAKLFKLTLTGKFFSKTHTSCKYNRRPFGTPASQMNYLQYILYIHHLRRSDAKLKAMYARYTQRPDFSKKFVYYAAAFQPEAGIWNIYNDQLLVLDILSASLPNGWVLYYKEHPTQFMPGGKGSFARNDEYYKKISSYKNIIMVPSTINSFALIDKAQAVATVCGTVGWEALLRAKPALIFGPVWYEGCKSVFKINTTQECMDAFKKIEQGYVPDQGDVERYAAAVEQLSGKNIIHGNLFRDQEDEDRDINYEMQRIAELFYQTYAHNFERETDLCGREQ